MTLDKEMIERIVRLETETAMHAQTAAQHAAIARRERESIENHLQSFESKLDRIDKELTRYRGIIGGILFVGTALMAFFKLFWADLKRFVGID